MIDFLFISLEKHRVSASVDPRNVSSVRVLERVGLRKEAHFVKSFFMDEMWCYDCIYAVLKEEWRERGLPC